MPCPPHLTWIYPGYLLRELDSATWLETSRELKNLGWRVSLIAADATTGTQTSQGMEVICLSRPDIYLLRQVLFHLRVLWFLLRRWNEVDVILFHQGSAPYLLPLRLPRALLGGRGPLLVKDTRTVPMTVATGRDRIRALFEAAMDRAANRLADGQTIITKRMADSIKVPKEQRWGYWPSGVNADRFCEALAARTWPEHGELVKLIYIGSLYSERHLAELCQAVVKCRQSGSNVFLTIVGTGPQRHELEGIAQNYPAAISVLSAVPHAEVPALLATAHVGVLPFPDEEKFRVSSPIKLFEYMAAGMPILATRIVCHTDVVGDQPFVFWAEDGDVDSLAMAVQRVWRSSATLPKLGERAVHTVDGWTWKASARKLSNALQSHLKSAVHQVKTPVSDTTQKQV